jgi:hypothetical protein
MERKALETRLGSLSVGRIAIIDGCVVWRMADDRYVVGENEISLGMAPMTMEQAAGSIEYVRAIRA